MNFSIYLQWINANKKAYNIRFYENTWVNSQIPFLFNFKTEIDFEGRTFSGFSSDTNREMASFKSFVEAIERACSYKIGVITTNGCAVHFNSKQAEKLATNELLERDIFLFYVFNGIKLPPIRPSLFSIKILKLINSIQKLGPTVRLFRLKDLHLNDLYACNVDFEKFEKGSIWCLGRNQFHAVKETLHDVLLTLDEDVPPLSLENFLKISAPTFNDHYRLSLDPSFNFELFQSLSNENPNTNNPANIIFNHQTFNLAETIFPGLPLFFSRTTSVDCQQLVTGEINNSNYNKGRFNIDITELRNLIHPLG